MRHILFVAVALFSSVAAPSGPEDSQAVSACLMCRDQLKKGLEACNSNTAGEARDLCRENAQRQANECAKDKVTAQCNLDLLMEAPKKAEPAKS